MARSFLQFSPAELDLLQRVTAHLLDVCRRKALEAKRRGRTHRQHESDAARYERGLRWIERAIRNGPRATRPIRPAQEDARHRLVLALPGRARV
jgi:hypothetical protein